MLVTVTGVAFPPPVVPPLPWVAQPIISPGVGFGGGVSPPLLGVEVAAVRLVMEPVGQEVALVAELLCQLDPFLT